MKEGGWDKTSFYGGLNIFALYLEFGGDLWLSAWQIKNNYQEF